ncbi:MAG: sensor domain-containing diguanylate cyclase [Acidimicrobiia bacterium]|nr:diguanylate cyclase [Acidimicrobiia bacterium]NNF68265.1 sensor domain-containing diguanylate cyclase [Acidimicrobiia bacterium]NNK91386.1 sensor domain-containing diguanylate cyclase [Acidimicrobiia bacterium]
MAIERVQDTALNLERLTALAELELTGASLKAVLNQVVDTVARLLPAGKGSTVVMWDAVDEVYQLAASTLPGQESGTVTEGLRTEGGATRWIIEQRRAYVCTNIEMDRFDPNQITKDFGIGSYAGVPIIADGRVLGVLYALEDVPREFDKADLAFLTTLARRAGTAIVDARLHDSNRAALRRTETMAFVSQALVGLSDLDEVLRTIIDGVVGALDADRVVLITLDTQHERVDRYRIGGPGSHLIAHDSYEDLMSGLTGWVVRNQQTALSPRSVPDQRESTALQQRRRDTHGGSVVVAPLRLKGDVIGTLTAVRPFQGADFSPDDAATLEGLSTLAAVAIDNARLSGETRSALTEVRGMYKIMEALNTEGGMGELLDRLAALVAEVLPCDRVSFLLLDVEGRDVYRIVAGGPGADQVSRDMTFDEIWSGLGGWAIRNRRPTRSPDGEPEPRESPEVRERRRATGAGAVLAVPLFHQGESLGVLTAIKQRGDGDFSQRDLELAAAMAGQISVAVANAKLLEELHRLAVTDDLTQVPNRRQLFELGERSYAASIRYGRPLSAIMFDLDEFKRVNDTYGHAVGDEVLVAVVERCLPVIREVDVLGRYGGEEFAVILPETGPEGALEIAERLRAAVADRPLETAAGMIRVTVSVGVATANEEVKNVHGLLDSADAAMFLAKHLGRNRVEKS